jgi:hypothetical protein
LVVLPGVTISSANYTISGDGYSKNGSIDVSGGGNTFATTIAGIPAGDGYHVTLTATASDDTTGSGSATFNVTDLQVTTVSVVLRFNPPTPITGGVLVNGTTNVCPHVASITALPATIPVGGASKLTVDASDPDNQPTPLTYAWTVSPAGIGTLSSTTVANPTFTASSPGTATLTLTIADGDDPCQTTSHSRSSLPIQITVTGSGSAGSSAAGGSAASSGGADNGAAGSAAAGSGGADSGDAGSCKDGSGGAGNGAAGSPVSGSGGAGSGIAGSSAAGVGGTGGGAAGSGGTAGSTAAGSSGAAGNAAAGSGGAGGSSAAGSAGAATGASGSGSTGACSACEGATHDDNTSCPDSRATGLALAGNTPVLSGIAESTGQAKSLVFQQILDCFHSNHCATTADTDCFCGAGVDPNNCFSTGTFDSATGPCKNLVAIGAESTAIGDINNRFFDPQFAIGAATAVIETCDQFSCVTECL